MPTKTASDPGEDSFDRHAILERTHIGIDIATVRYNIAAASNRRYNVGVLVPFSLIFLLNALSTRLIEDP